MNADIVLVIALIVGGFFLVLVEIFLLPGLITGIIGLVLIVWGIVISYREFGSSGAAISIISSCAAGTILLIAMIRLKIWRRFVLNSDQKGIEGYVATDQGLKNMIGKPGEAFTFLRPSGQVKIDGARYDAMTQGKFLEKGTPITVIQLSGQQLVVEAVTEFQQTDR